MTEKRYSYGRSLWLVILVLLGLPGCTLSKDYSELSGNVVKISSVPVTYTIQSGDVLSVKFPYTPKHNEDVVVRSDGVIMLESAGDVHAAGLSPEGLSQIIADKVSKRMRNPKVIVAVKNSAQKIYVGGEVGDAGIVPYRKDITALQAIFERGGFKDTAQWDKIFIVRIKDESARIIEMERENAAAEPLMANDVIYVPKTGIAKANLAVQQYIRDLVPFSTFKFY